MNKIKYLNKYQIFLMSFFQIVFVVGLLKDIKNNGSIVNLNKSLLPGALIIVVSIIILYGYIVKKFWHIKIYLIYKIFSILNIIYICNMSKNCLSLFIPIKYSFVRSINFIIVIFLIGNLILILTYNRNARELNNKEETL